MSFQSPKKEMACVCVFMTLVYDPEPVRFCTYMFDNIMMIFFNDNGPVEEKLFEVDVCVVSSDIHQL